MLTVRKCARLHSTLEGAGLVTKSLTEFHQFYTLLRCEHLGGIGKSLNSASANV